MRTRSVEIPILIDDETIVADPDPTMVDSPTMVGIPVQVGRERTLDLDTTLRHPAESHFFIRAGFEAGAPTDIIADSIADGDEWVIGPAWLTRNGSWRLVVSLSDPDVPADRRIAAWRPIKER